LSDTSICILPELKGIGGPSSFQTKLMAGLGALGVSAHHDPDRADTRAILVIGSSRHFSRLLAAKRRGIRIVQRLDGMNWLHKRHFTGIRHFLRSERMNLQLAITRRRLADRVVYQSTFTRDWWNTVYGPSGKKSQVVHNGVDLKHFHPQGDGKPPEDFIRVLVVEGSFKGGHERDLFNAVEAADRLSAHMNRKVELMIVGNAPMKMREQVTFGHRAQVRWMGVVPHKDIPKLDRSAHLLFPAEINAACPNSVVEALACGLPIVSYATGSLPELVGEDGGMVVPYGANFWKLEPPDTDELVKAAAKVLNDLPNFRASARQRAETYFGLDEMVAAYHSALLDD
jgi:glycosyltransferase involved in cell wall biosynthesis